MQSAKKELLTGLLISLLVLGMFFWRTVVYQSAILPPISSQPVGLPGITALDVAKHNSQSDCWLIINNKILNVTTFLAIHPGGADPILPYCGKDGTQAFNSIKNGTGHSADAVAKFSNYLLGLVGQEITPTSTAVPTPKASLPSNATLTLAEIAKHNSASDCWIIINTKVLKITTFLNLHPGGPGAITPYCGTGSTSAFNSIKNGSGHSGSALAMFADYLIGLVGQSVSPNILTATPAPTVISKFTGRGEDD